jgi:hypothetical protein
MKRESIKHYWRTAERTNNPPFHHNDNLSNKEGYLLAAAMNKMTSFYSIFVPTNFLALYLYPLAQLILLFVTSAVNLGLLKLQKSVYLCRSANFMSRFFSYCHLSLGFLNLSSCSFTRLVCRNQQYGTMF